MLQLCIVDNRYICLPTHENIIVILVLSCILSNLKSIFFPSVHISIYYNNERKRKEIKCHVNHSRPAGAESFEGLILIN